MVSELTAVYVSPVSAMLCTKLMECAKHSLILQLTHSMKSHPDCFHFQSVKYYMYLNVIFSVYVMYIYKVRYFMHTCALP